MATSALPEYYAYLHCTPDGIPFYVGKGVNRRATDFSNRSSKHKSKVGEVGANNVVVAVMSCSSQETAFALERGMIKCLRRSGVVLVNHRDGGDGVPVWVDRRHSKETIAKIRGSKKGAVATATQLAVLNAYREEARKRSIEAISKAVRCVNTGESFKSAAGAAKFFGVHKASVCKVAKGLRTAVHGLRFEYI